MDCTLIAAFKEVNKVCFQSLLEDKNGHALHLQIRLQIGSPPPLFHRRHHLFSPRMCCASWMSFGMIVTHFAWIAHSLLSSKRQTRYASEASWRARTAVLCIHKSDLKSVAISLTRRWKGAFLIKRSVFFWYLRISRMATVPGQ
jgi:hypothetical protein